MTAPTLEAPFAIATKTRLYRAVAVATLFLLLSLCFVLMSDYYIGPYDEGIILTGAFRVLNGDLPSQDFYCNYGPAQFCILAALFKVFGTNLLVARLYDSALCALIVMAAFFIVNRLTTRSHAIAAAMFVAALLISHQVHLYPITPIVLVSVVTVAQLANVLARPQSYLAYLSLSIGIAAVLLFRYDIAVLMTVAVAIPIVLVHLRRCGSATGTVRACATQIVVIFSLLAAVPLIALVCLYVAGILEPAITDIVTHNLSNYVEMRSLPFPGPQDALRKPDDFLFVYFALAVSVVSICVLVHQYLQHRRGLSILPNAQIATLLVFTPVTMFFYTKGCVRVSGQHFLLANVPATLLMFIVMHAISMVRKAALSTSRPLSVKIAVAVSVAFLALAIRGNWARSNPLYRNLAQAHVSKELSSLSIFSVEERRLSTARFIVNHSTKNDRLLSSTGRHDKIFVNDVSLYFLTQRMPATRWHHYDPGVITKESVQREIVAELERAHPLILVRVSSWDQANEPNKSAESSHVFLLDEYLADRFVARKSYGDYELYESATREGNPYRRYDRDSKTRELVDRQRSTAGPR